METVATKKLADAVQDLAPLIRDRADPAERERRVSRSVVDAMVEAGFFRMLTPRSLGGLEVDPLTCATVIEDVARLDSAAGWLLVNSNSVAWWCARLPEEGVEEIYGAGPDVIISAAFHPPVEAVRAEGGFRLSGRRPLASGVQDSSWLMLTALVSDGRSGAPESPPEPIGALVPTREAEVVDTWHTLGMRGTDSNDVLVRDLFVPASRTYPLVPEFERGTHFQGPLYRISTMAEVSLIAVPVFLGVAREAIDELRRLAQGKTPFGSTRLLRERAAAQAGLARAEAVLRSGRLFFRQVLQEDWGRARASASHSLEQKADALLAGVHAVDSAVTAVDIVARLAGTTGIYTRSPIERHLRDVLTLRHHGFVAESRYEAVGQVYFGVPPEYGLVAL